MLAACGKVGDPRPPIIRITTRVDLSVSQNGYQAFLTWTNPAKYVDGNAATDTGVVHVFRNGAEIGTVPATAAGQPQSFAVDVANAVGMELTFTIQHVLPKASKPSPVSTVARITPVNVPGPPGGIVATVDQDKVVLVWPRPERNPELVAGYLVQRADKPAPEQVPNPRFEDGEFEVGKTYRYTVTALRGNPQILGDGSVVKDVVAIDETRPAMPVGLDIISIGDDAVFLQWQQNSEADLKGYTVYRSDRPDTPIPVGNTNGYTDREYVSGKGISYQIVAVDASGNTSDKSAPKPGP
jgi:hypothetical protein